MFNIDPRTRWAACVALGRRAAGSSGMRYANHNMHRQHRVAKQVHQENNDMWQSNNM